MLHVFTKRAPRYHTLMHPTPRDIATFEALQKHGVLPSHYLYELTKHIAHDSIGYRKRLKQLVEAGYLERPQSVNNPLIKTDFLCYWLRPKAYEVLAVLGKRNVYATQVGGSHQHALMSACITANIELGCRAAGFRFIAQEEILAGANCPKDTKLGKSPLSIPTHIDHSFGTHKQRSDTPTTPDQLFGIDYGNGVRIFALEADRGTETVEPTKSLKVNSILRKLLGYQNILETSAAKKRFGIPNFIVLFVTTSEPRVQSMVDLTRDVFKNGTKNICFTSVPGFHVYFRTPPLLPQVFGVYQTTREPFDISKA